MKIFSILTFCLIALSSTTLLAEVAHIDSQCPDLNGKYTTGSESEPMRVETSRGASGEFRFGIAFYADGWISTDPVDGQTKTESDAGSSYRYACNDQKVYLYRNGSNVNLETRWSLDSAKNFDEVVIDHGVTTHKVYPRL